MPELPNTTESCRRLRLVVLVRRMVSATLGGLILASLLLVSSALGQANAGYSSKRLERPRGTINQPFDAPILLGAYGQIGGGFKFDQGQPGFGALILFRPGRAANFFSFLYDWNASLVLQADYQKVSPDCRILSGDLIIRHYLQDMRDPATEVSPFVGVGFGGSEVTLPPGAGRPHDQYWSWLLELGQEWNYRVKYLLFVKGQFRHYSFGGYNYSTWSLQAGAGLPLPW